MEFYIEELGSISVLSLNCPKTGTDLALETIHFCGASFEYCTEYQAYIISSKDFLYWRTFLAAEQDILNRIYSLKKRLPKETQIIFNAALNDANAGVESQSRLMDVIDAFEYA